MNKKYLPMALNVDGRECLVIGSDREAIQKAERLRRFGAKVTGVKMEEFSLEMIQDQFMVFFSLQKNAALTKKVFDTCRKKKILLCTIDQADYCDVVNMSLYDRGALKIAVSTDAVSPALARKIREGLEESLKDVPLESFLEQLRQLRESVQSINDADERRRRLIAAVDNVKFEAHLSLPKGKSK